MKHFELYLYFNVSSVDLNEKKRNLEIPHASYFILPLRLSDKHSDPPKKFEKLCPYFDFVFFELQQSKMKKYTAVLVNERQVQNPVCGVYKPWDRVDEDDSEEDSEDEFQNLSFKEMKSSATGGKRLFQRKKQKKVRGNGVMFMIC